MCENIVAKHSEEVFCYDHHEENIQALVKKGAIACKNEIDVAQNADIIITMVPKSEHSAFVYNTILPFLTPQKICIDMSTISPSVSVELAQKVKNAGADFADAPVVKSRPAALLGKLGIYVGASEELFQKILPILHYMGENVIRMGENGSGLVMKICHNALVSQIQNGVNETLALAGAHGISVETFAKAISYGGAQNFYLDSKKEVISSRDFTTAFSVENMAKDVGLALDLAAQKNLNLLGEKAVSQVYNAALEKGLGKKDFSATFTIVNGEA